MGGLLNRNDRMVQISAFSITCKIFFKEDGFNDPGKVQNFGQCTNTLWRPMSTAASCNYWYLYYQPNLNVHKRICCNEKRKVIQCYWIHRPAILKFFSVSKPLWVATIHGVAFELSRSLFLRALKTVALETTGNAEFLYRVQITPLCSYYFLRSLLELHVT